MYTDKGSSSKCKGLWGMTNDKISKRFSESEGQENSVVRKIRITAQDVITFVQQISPM